MDWPPFIGGVVAGVAVVVLVLFAIFRANEKAAAAKKEEKTQPPAAAAKPIEGSAEAKASEVEAQALPEYRADEEGATAGPLGELDA